MTQNIDDKIAYLKEFVSPERFDRLLTRVNLRTRYMTMCLEDIFYPHNASAVIRSAEAFGIQDIHAVQSLCHFSPSKDIVRGTDQWINLRRWDTTPELVGHLREQGYRIVVTSPHQGGHTPDTFDIHQGPFALFMGTEKTGISEWLASQADQYIQIPMVGFAESLNISVSAAIIASRLTERLRAEEGLQWQISTNERDELLYQWLRCSIKDVDNILNRKF